MKRHSSLAPFSRDHNVGLVLARRLTTSPSTDTLLEFLEVWRDELKEHFDEEERLLLPVADEKMGARLRREHERIASNAAAAERGMVGDPGVVRLGRLLYDHIRWEERVLFPAIEATATPEQLQKVAEETAELEKRRANSKHSPRRGELMKNQATKDGQ